MKRVWSSLNSSALPTMESQRRYAVVNHRCEIRFRRFATVGRMIGFAKTPEKMLYSIGRIEQAVKKARLKRLQLVQHHCFTITPGDRALVEEGFFRDSLVVQSRMIFNHAGRMVEADVRREIGGIFGRVTDREQGRIGIKVDRRGVNRQIGLDANEMKSEHSPDRLQQAKLEFDPQPTAPGTLCRSASSFGVPSDNTTTRRPEVSNRNDIEAAGRRASWDCAVRSRMWRILRPAQAEFVRRFRFHEA